MNGGRYDAFDQATRCQGVTTTLPSKHGVRDIWPAWDKYLNIAFVSGYKQGKQLMLLQLTDTSTKASHNRLDSVAKQAIDNRPLCTFAFKPLVFSSGGLLSRETADKVQSWQKLLGDTVYGRLGTDVSLQLVRARSRLTADAVSPGTFRNTIEGTSSIMP